MAFLIRNMPSAGSGGSGGGSSTQGLTGLAQTLGVSIGAPSAGSSSGSRGEAPLFFYQGPGRPIPIDARGDFIPTRSNGPSDQTSTRPGALSAFEQKSLKEKRHMAFLLALAGFVDGVDPFKALVWAETASLGEIMTAYNELLSDAATRYMNGQKVTPEDVLRQEIQFNMPGMVEWDGNLDSLTPHKLDKMFVKQGLYDTPLLGDEPGEDEEPFVGVKKTKHISRSILDPADARGLTRDLLQRELGRDPTQAEYEDFVSTLQATLRESPTVSVQKDRYALDEGDPTQSRIVESTSRTRQGIGAAGLEQIATEKARSLPDWAEWQAVGTYTPALFQALGSAVPGV